jgi:hypothetical protein
MPTKKKTPTTTTKKPTTKRAKLSEIDRLQVSAQKASERESNRGRATKRQRPNYLAKGERRD